MQEIVRTIEMENGNKVNFTSGPRHPFWRVSFEKGGMPKELQGQYTDFDRAVLAVKTYLERRHMNKTTLKGKVKTTENLSVEE